MTGDIRGHTNSHVVVPTSIFYSLLSAALLGGFGLGPIISPNPAGDALTQCANTAAAALELGTQQARYIADLQDNLAEGTRDRHTKAEQLIYERAQANRDAQQDRNIEFLEKLVRDG